MVANAKGRPWVERQTGISNISIELTLGITSFCLHRGFFFVLVDAASRDEVSAVSLEWVPPGRSDGVVGEAGDSDGYRPLSTACTRRTRGRSFLVHDRADRTLEFVRSLRANEKRFAACEYKLYAFIAADIVRPAVPTVPDAPSPVFPDRSVSASVEFPQFL